MNDLGIERTAYRIRENIIDMLAEAGSGHTGGPLGLADIFATLYFGVLRHDPKRPGWEGRDRLVLSAGHTCPVLYSTLAEAGYFPRRELLTLRKFGSRLQGHPHNEALPGVETSSGPLGQGVSQAIGMALALPKSRVYIVAGDGEHQEGQVWEGVMFAGARRLSNLVMTIDRNQIQIDGPTEEVLALEPLGDKYRSFNWHVIEVDGNDVGQLRAAYAQAREVADRPTCVLAHTLPGRGVSYMEGDYRWHGIPPGLQDVSGAPPKADQVEVALQELIARSSALASRS